MKVRIDRRGPTDHGVVLHAQAVVRMVRSTGVVVVGDGRADLTHAQFTDALWGPDVGTAAAAFVVWAECAPRPVVVTLHDVPGGDPDTGRDARRRRGYEAVVAASDGVIVSSAHEADKVRRLGPGRDVTVIELPLPEVPPRIDLAPPWAQGPSLGVLGFVYPGKGHVDVIDAAARQNPVPRVLSLGATSPGHDRLRRDLQRHATDRRVELVVTGRLPEAILAAAIDAVTVPVAPSRLVSASASLLTWIAQRRRPLCADGAYSREIAVRYPGSVQRYSDASGLDELLGKSLGDPGATRLGAPPAWPDVGARHAHLYARVIRDHSASQRQPPQRQPAERQPSPARRHG